MCFPFAVLLIINMMGVKAVRQALFKDQGACVPSSQIAVPEVMPSSRRLSALLQLPYEYHQRRKPLAGALWLDRSVAPLSVDRDDI